VSGYWERVTVEDPTEERTDTGAVTYTWATHLADAEARVLPLDISERDEDWARPEEDAYEVQFRGASLGLRPRMRVVAGSDYYDIRRILEPPPFGTPTTVAWTVRHTP